MKKWVLSVIFLLGAGGAFFTTRHFIHESSPPYHEVSSDARACNVSCCLPEDIQLSSAQKEAIRNLERVYCQCRDNLTVQIDQKRLALAELLLQPKPDLSAVDNLLVDIAKLQAELEKQTIRHILEVRSQLPSQQQSQFIKSIVNELRWRCRHQELLKSTS